MTRLSSRSSLFDLAVSLLQPCCRCFHFQSTNLLEFFFMSVGKGQNRSKTHNTRRMLTQSRETMIDSRTHNTQSRSSHITKANLFLCYTRGDDNNAAWITLIRTCQSVDALSPRVLRRLTLSVFLFALRCVARAHERSHFNGLSRGNFPLES